MPPSHRPSKRVTGMRTGAKGRAKQGQARRQAESLRMVPASTPTGVSLQQPSPWLAGLHGEPGAGDRDEDGGESEDDSACATASDSDNENDGLEEIMATFVAAKRAASAKRLGANAEKHRKRLKRAASKILNDARAAVQRHEATATRARGLKHDLTELQKGLTETRLLFADRIHSLEARINAEFESLSTKLAHLRTTAVGNGSELETLVGTDLKKHVVQARAHAAQEIETTTGILGETALAEATAAVASALNKLQRRLE